MIRERLKLPSEMIMSKQLWHAATDAYYSVDSNICGGPCHVVLDDGNLGDEHIKFCLAACKEKGDWFGEMLMTHLLTIPYEQRETYTSRWVEEPAEDIG